MKTTRGFEKRLVETGALAAAATLAAVAAASAASPVRGAAYVGSYSDGQTSAISFKVSASGGRVTALTVSTPIKCQGGCGGIGSGSPATARISKSGKFKVKLNLDFPPGSHKSEGTETVTGKFLAHGIATGTVSSHFKHGASSDRTVHWTATSAG